MADGGGVIRADMVEAARKFMLTPKVRETPFDEQRQFLMGKGVTDAEISEARASIPQEQLVPQIGQTSFGHPPLPPPYQQPNKVVSIAQTAMVLGAVTYTGYRFVRSVILPRFFDIPDPATEELRQLQEQVNDLQNSIKFVMDSVSQTTQQLATQQAEITRTLYSISNRDADLTRVEAGISTIKSLLLSQHNFAPIVAPAVTTIPSWQSASVVTTTSIPSWQTNAAPATPLSSPVPQSDAGYMTPPANFRGPQVDYIPDDLDNEFVVNSTERKTPV